MRHLFAALSLFAVAVAPSFVAAEEISGSFMEVRTSQVYTGPCFSNAEMKLSGKDPLLAWKNGGLHRNERNRLLPAADPGDQLRRRRRHRRGIHRQGAGHHLVRAAVTQRVHGDVYVRVMPAALPDAESLSRNPHSGPLPKGE